MRLWVKDTSTEGTPGTGCSAYLTWAAHDSQVTPEMSSAIARRVPRPRPGRFVDAAMRRWWAGWVGSVPRGRGGKKPHRYTEAGRELGAQPRGHFDASRMHIGSLQDRSVIRRCCGSARATSLPRRDDPLKVVTAVRTARPARMKPNAPAHRRRGSST